MDTLLGFLGIAVGLAVGGVAGFWTGTRVRGRRRAYWALNAGVVLVCAGLDFAGLVSGRFWLASSAIGLMAGLITGMKYGYSDAIGVWRKPAPADVDAGAVPETSRGASSVASAQDTDPGS